MENTLTKTYEIKLTLKELRLIKGEVSKEAQTIIDYAEEEALSGLVSEMMNEILMRAKKEGKLVWQRASIRSCDLCDKSYDYVRYKRNTQYHNKGDRKFDKPIYYRGIKFNAGAVTYRGQGDMCMDCCENHNVIEQLINHIIEEDLHVQLMRNDYTLSKYLIDDKRICFECEESMFESEMGTKPTFMGDGTFPAVCPHCQAEAVPFGASHKTTQEYQHILNPEFQKVDSE